MEESTTSEEGGSPVESNDVDMEESSSSGGAAKGVADDGGYAADVRRTDKPRLLITKIVMENFKSYGGEREIGPFHKCFSSIVGPNGSGKSNVIDAMLFVFGKRAKQLRLNKVSELIHRSDTFPNLDFARVSVHFVDIIDKGDDEDNYEEVPGTQLVVTRVARMDNSSTYKVDGKTMQFNDVAALLRKRGIDLDHNRFLILQGEVEQIAMMKPKGQAPHEDGLLEYLEDIIGSNQYVERIDEVAKEVEVFNEQRTEKLNRLKAAEKEKEALTGSKTEAEEYLTAERQIRAINNVLFQCNISECGKNAEKVGAKADELKQKLDQERGQMKETEKGLKAAEARYEVLQKEYAEVNKELTRVKDEWASFERKDIKHQEDMKFAAAQVKKAEAAAKKEGKTAKEAAAKAESLASSIPALEKTIATAEKTKAKEEAALEEMQEELKGETEALRAQLEESQAKAAPVREEAEQVKNQIETIQCEMNLLEESTKTAKSKLKGTEAALAKLHEKASANRQELAAANKDKEEMDGKIRQGEQEQQAAEEQCKEASAAMTAAVTAAEEAAAAREAMGGRSTALTGLLKAARKGGALEKAGICGRLGDLASISDEYDVAVSTACTQLDFVVVDTTSGGTACVQYLRDNNLGRLSFIILEQLGHLQEQMNKNFMAPAGCPRLYDLVTIPDNKYRPAFYLGLRDTLVADNLDAAVAVAYQGGRCLHRVVTAAGQLIDKSGTMSGGGNSVRKGGMGKAKGNAAAAVGGMSDAEFKGLQQAAQRAEQSMSQARDRKRKADEELRRLTKRQNDLLTVIPKLQMQLGGVDASEQQYKEQIEKLREQTELSAEEAKQVATLKKKLAEEQAKYDKIEKVLEKLEVTVSKLQKGILEVGGDRLKKAMKKAEDANQELDSAVGELSAAKVGSVAEAKKAEKAEKAEKAKSDEAEKFTLKLKSLEEEFKELEQAAMAVMEEVEKVQASANDKKEELDSITVDYDKAKAVVAKIKSAEVDMANQLEDLVNKRVENEERRDAWKDKLTKMRNMHEQEMAEWGAFEDEDEEDEEAVAAAAAATAAAAAAAEKEAEEEEEEEDDDEEDGEEGGEGEGGDAMEVDDDDDEGASSGGKKKRKKPEKASKKKKGKDGKEKLTKKDKAVAAAAADAAAKKRKKHELFDLTDEELESANRDQLKDDLTVQEKQRDKLKGSVNMNTLLEYRKKEGEYLIRVKDLSDVTEKRDAARRRHEEMRRKRLDDFMAGFGVITLKLKEMYQMITLGGDAELELVDSLDPFSEGIVFSVRPPKKSWKNIANLSGGEKTLSSLALVFALHHFKPTPLYVMDEIDAALDFKNVSIVANYIKERTKDAQFIIISLRNNMFEVADRLVGIYKTHNVTKSVTVNPKRFGQISSSSSPSVAVGASGGGGGASSLGQ